MHSSRMHTVHNCSHLMGGVWYWVEGVSGPGGCLPRGVVSQHALRQTPPVDRHTGVKT